MSPPPRRRSFLSPLDALDLPSSPAAQGDARCPGASVASSHIGLSSLPSTGGSASDWSPPRHWPFDAWIPQPVTGEERRIIVSPRRYSEQDIKTRTARASLGSVFQGHRTTSSYPIISPLSPKVPRYPVVPPSPPMGAVQDMESFRLYTRPSSAGSSLRTRSSFESRNKTPLSISSSMSSVLSFTSEDSSTFSEGKPKYGLNPQAPITQTALPPIKRITVDMTVPPYARYGFNGGEGSRYTQTRGLGPRSPARIYPERTGEPLKRGNGFKKLPKELLLVILAELKKLHLNNGNLGCPTCLMRDLVNVGLSCKKWWTVAQCTLYEDIRLIGSDAALHSRKKFRAKFGARLKLLRRTLRARPDLSLHVISLKVPFMPDSARTKNDQEEYLDIVASLVMTCPNLERLPGFYPTYNHEFDRLVHALSTRTKLVEKVWVINPSHVQRQRRYKLSDNLEHLIPILVPGPLLPDQCFDLLSYHSQWANLRTLFFHCNPGGMVDSILFTDIFNSLPLLENLHVSSFPASSFNDGTLLSLPPLKMLRLENLPGITDAGIANYASTNSTECLTSLSLISLPLLSLPVLTRLLSHLRSLTRFQISQAPSPSLSAGMGIFLHPYLASRTLEYLHWEFINPDSDEATLILAKSIQFGGFPSLKILRAPTDHEGLLQNLCRPLRRIEMPGDRYRNFNTPKFGGLSQSPSTPSIPSPTNSTFSLQVANNPSGFIKSPTWSTFSLNLDQISQPECIAAREVGMSLATARRMAQRRIDLGPTQPRLYITIWDENDNMTERFGVSGYVGNIQSGIRYNLNPDIDGMDDAIVRFDGPCGMLERGGEINVGDGCNGSWNLEAAPLNKSDGKRKDRWWHTDRGRWRDTPLETFF